MKIDVWTTHSLDKVFPESERPPQATQAISLKAGRNETEDAQVAVRVPRGVEIRRASFEVPDLVGESGATIPKEQLSASWIWPIYVLNNPPANADPASYLRRAPAFFPDAFLEESTIAIRDQWTQSLWVSVDVPKETPPGDYGGTLLIDLVSKSGEEERIEVPMTVQVWPFTLPDEFHLHHTEWFSPSVIADYYRIEPWSEEHWSWLEKIASDMARHKQDMIVTPFASLVRVTRLKSGQYSYDFSRLDRWVEMFKRAGVDWVEGGHVAGRADGFRSDIVWHRIPVRDESGERIDTSREGMPEEEFEPIIEQFLKAIHAHLRERGWAERYVQHIADEPIPENEASWKAVAQKVKAWLPGVSTIDAVMSEGLGELVDWRVPQIQHVGPEASRREGEELWSYVCLAPQGQYPNRFLDYASIRNRIIFWLSWSLGLKGFLHWGYAFWIRWQGVPVDVRVSPWLDATGASIYCADREPLPAGDPHIVYPGEEQICSSIRWEVVRKGFEDFEYLYLLERAVEAAPPGRDQAAAAARNLLERVRREIAPDPLNHTRDEAALLSAREEAGRLLAALAPEE